MFSALIGNEKAKEILSRLLAKQTLPHVLLLHGPDGVGKGHFAYEIAQTLMGRTKKEHPDIHLILPDPKSDQHPVAHMRQLIQEAGLPPFEAPVKIFIIHDAEKMLPASSNTLLKTLEEPPPRTHFILLTSQPELLLPTIVSRCCKIPFFPIPDDELANFIMQKFHTQDGRKIALLAQGSAAQAVRRASRASEASNFPLDELFRAKTYTELHEQLGHLNEPSDEASQEEIDQLFEEILYWIREHDPLHLDRAVPLIAESRQALHHHVKLKNVLEHFFVTFAHS
ncbi:MAG TPA: AAA family ATPase [Rhabdochlamydiaceae bacterium]|nr:AAA family ATPase [Rhabdochlamydiaceae bacterium]